MYKNPTFWIILLCSILLVSQVSAADVPLPAGAGREEAIESELQKASGWAQRENEEQSQENMLKRENKVISDIDQSSKKFESDKKMGDMTDERLQEKAHLVDVKDVSQELQQKFAQDNVAVMERNKSASYAAFNKDENTFEVETEAFENHQQGPHQFEIAPEVYYYKYTESIGVKVKGMKGGLTGAYQYRFSENESIDSWGDFLRDASKPNIFRLEGRMSYGKVDYEGSGTVDGIPDWNFETRGLVGMEVPVREVVVLTPYAGLGYRYLYNDFSKAPAKFIGAQEYYSGYDRESTYIYIPLGMEAKTKLDHQWSFAVKGEFDIFLWGKQISHFEDMVDTSGTGSGLDKLENTQKQGFGWRFSARLSREAGRFDFFVEPFIRYWHIEDSEIELITAGGSAICQGNLCSAGLEPDNKTWEYGLNLGAKF